MLLHFYERRPLKFLRRAALRRAERWIVQRQEADGSWGGIQPPWVYSLIALRLQGYSLEHPVMHAGITGLDGFTIEDDAGPTARGLPVPGVGHRPRRHRARRRRPLPRRPRAALGCALPAEPRDHGARATGRFVARTSSRAAGPLSSKTTPIPTSTTPPKWSSRSRAHRRAVARRASAAGSTGSSGMQSRDGGWAAFDVDNVQTLCRELPFCDFGELIDPSSADVTAHVLEALGRAAKSTASRSSAA